MQCKVASLFQALSLLLLLLLLLLFFIKSSLRQRVAHFNPLTPERAFWRASK